MCFLFCFHSQVDPSPLIMWLLAAPAGFLGGHCHTVWRIGDQTDLGHVPSLNYNLEKRDFGLGAPAPAFPEFWRLRMVKGGSLRKNQNCYPNSRDRVLGSQSVNVYRYTANCFFTLLWYWILLNIQVPFLVTCDEKHQMNKTHMVCELSVSSPQCCSYTLGWAGWGIPRQSLFQGADMS